MKRTRTRGDPEGEDDSAAAAPKSPNSKAKEESEQEIEAEAPKSSTRSSKASAKEVSVESKAGGKSGATDAPAEEGTRSSEPKKTLILDCQKKLRRTAYQIGYFALTCKNNTTYKKLREVWAENRLNLRSNFNSMSELVDWMVWLHDALHEGYQQQNWKKENSSWLTSVKSCNTITELNSLLAQLSSSINWEKLRCIHSLIDAIDMIPASEVTTNSDHFWSEVLLGRLRDATDPASFCKVLIEVEGTVKRGSEVLEEEWTQGRLVTWVNKCKKCNDWKKATELFKEWETVAIDWESAIQIMKENKREQAAAPKGKGGAKAAAKGKAGKGKGKGKWKIDGGSEKEATEILMQLGSSEPVQAGGKKGAKAKGAKGKGKQSKPAAAAGKGEGGPDTESEDDKGDAAGAAVEEAAGSAEPKRRGAKQAAAVEAHPAPVMVVAQPADRALRSDVSVALAAQAYPLSTDHATAVAATAQPAAAGGADGLEEAEGGGKRARGKRKGGGGAAGNRKKAKAGLADGEGSQAMMIGGAGESVGIVGSADGMRLSGPVLPHFEGLLANMGAARERAGGIMLTEALLKESFEKYVEAYRADYSLACQLLQHHDMATVQTKQAEYKEQLGSMAMRLSDNSNGAQRALMDEIEATKAKLREQTYLQMDLIRSRELKQEYETMLYKRAMLDGVIRGNINGELPPGAPPAFLPPTSHPNGVPTV